MSSQGGSAAGSAERHATAATLRPLVSAALLDWDGTLVDSRAALLSAWRESTSRVLGRSYPATQAEEDLVFTLPGGQIWPTLAKDRRELAALAASFQAAYDRAAEEVRAFPRVPEVLERLRAAGVAIAVITSKARVRFEADARRAGIGRLIDVSICAEDADAAKPDPAPVLRALERLGAVGANSTMIGDTTVDIAAGAGAGTRTIGVAWGHGSEAALRAAGAEAIAHDPEELCALLLADRRAQGGTPSGRRAARSAA